MKKEIILTVIIIVTAIIVGLNLSSNTKATPKNIMGRFFSLKSIEALAAGETRCFGDPSKNTGVCRKAVNNTGDVCVDDDSVVTKKCYTHE